MNKDGQLIRIAEYTSEEKVNTLQTYLNSIYYCNPNWLSNEEQNVNISNAELENYSVHHKETKTDDELYNLRLPGCKVILEEDKVYGRQLIAKELIKAGEIVIIEPPMVLGPMGCSAQCLHCLSQVKGDFSCSDCGFFFCHENCLKGDISHAEECDDIKKLNLSETKYKAPKESFAKKLREKNKRERKLKEKESKNSVENEDDYRVTGLSSCEDEKAAKLKDFLDKASKVFDERKTQVVQKNLLVTTLRTLRVMEQNTNKCKTILSMQANVLPNSPQYKQHGKSMVEPIVKNIRKNTARYLLQKIAAVWDTNCFEVALGSQNRVQGMFPMAALINHSCRANLQQSFTPNGTMVMRAIDDIEKGNPLSIWYMNPLWPTRMRRKHLKETKFFDCLCPRCSDGTEHGTYMGSPLCRTCKSALLPDDPLNSESHWHCTNTACKFVMNNCQVSAMDAKLAPILLKVTGKNLVQVEDVVSGLEENLHPQNHLLLRIHLGAALYHSSFDITEYSEKDLATLLYSTKQLLTVLKAIEAPLATKRARIGREFLRCSLEQLRRRKDKEDIKPQVLALKEELDICCLCLSWSPNAPSMDEIIKLYYVLLE